MVERNPTLSAHEIEHLAREWMQGWLGGMIEKLDSKLDAGGARSIEEIRQRRADLERLLCDLRDRLARNDTAGAAPDADQLLSAKGIVLDRHSAEYQRLCRLLVRGHVAVAEILGARLDGQYDHRPSDPVFHDLPRANAQAAPHGAPTSLVVPASSAPNLSGLIRDQVNAEMSAWTKQTVRQNEATFRMFPELVGDIPAEAVARAHVSRFMEALRKLPSKYGQLPAFRGKTLPRMAKIAGRQGNDGPRMTLKTVDRHLSALSGIYNRAARHGRLTCSNPVTGLINRRRAEEQARDRRPWTADELNRLFALPVWRGCRSKARRSDRGKAEVRDAYFFVPLIGLFTGMRLDEICKLATADFRQVGEIWAVDVRANERGRLKERASKRSVPVHPERLRLGLIRHVLQAKARGQELLWPELGRSGPDKKMSSTFTKWFGRARQRAGMLDPLVDFHSFRHNAASALHAEGVPESTIADILGHGNKTMSLRRYSAGPALRTMHEAISKIHYDFVDLKDLYSLRLVDTA